MKFKFIGNAAGIFEGSKGTKILCDPWIVDGVFDGSWYHYPPLETKISDIQNVDAIYVSHIHPDHYDPIFLKKILKKYRKTKIIIPNFERNYLYNRMKFDGIDARPTKSVSFHKSFGIFFISLSSKLSTNFKASLLSIINLFKFHLSYIIFFR